MEVNWMQGEGIESRTIRRREKWKELNKIEKMIKVPVLTPSVSERAHLWYRRRKANDYMC
jgi:hypothetical protein